MIPFSGSYLANDVEFLLKPLKIEPITDLEKKERLIQSGQKHYSEMIGVEQQPDETYMRLFYQSIEDNLARMSGDLYWVCRKIRQLRRTDKLTIVSLARAGTPIGVGMKRLLEQEFHTPTTHYSVSIIRDRGIDQQALKYITSLHEPETIVMVDGWTGKGAIATEFEACMRNLTCPKLQRIPKELHVLCDLGGVSSNCGSTEDYLIPSAILNATISGLVSRTILNEMIGPDDFHGCVYYADLEPRDLSKWFVEALMKSVTEQLPSLRLQAEPICDLRLARSRMHDWLQALVEEFSIKNLNLIKPGVCEATRALLRRSANRLLVRNPADINTVHLVHLAEKNNVAVETREQMPFMATVLIRSFANG